METIVISSSNRKKVSLIREYADKIGLKVKVYTTEEKEDIGMVNAMKEGEKDKRTVRLSTFFKNLED
ncbi:MAG: hypothetical protein LC105_05445 [Chitinophagales bacterium]|nr:hypothetical protein [Chitinophagales bacterium]MCZ2393279.1 hypothetical protein [Chitinophagales bacterium]